MKLKIKFDLDKPSDLLIVEKIFGGGAPHLGNGGVQAPPAPKAHEPEIENIKVTLEELRRLITSKAITHREACKAKLTELGAANISSLNPVHYGTFHEFLIKLPA